MLVEACKPAHRTWGGLWLRFQVVGVDKDIVLLKQLPVGENEIIFVGRRRADGALADDSGAEILLRVAEAG